MADWHVLVELDLDGEMLRLSDVDGGLDVDPGDGGETLHFTPGLLEVSLPARSIDPMAGTLTAGDSASVRVAQAARDVWTLAQSRGVRLQACQGRAWLWQEGTTLTAARELMRGQLRSPSFDWDGDTFGCEIAPPVEAEDLEFPRGLIGDPHRFPDAPEGSLGSALPVIYGTTTGLQIYPVTDIVSSPIRVLIAGHPIVSTTVTVKDGNGADIGGNPYTVLEAKDALGQRYSYVPVVPANYVETMYVESVTGWRAPDGTAIERLGDVLEHLWTHYGERDAEALDRGRVFTARARLNRYAVGAAFDSPAQGTTIMQAISSRFAGQYPLTVGRVGGRMGWDAIDLDGVGEGKPAARIVFRQNAIARAPTSETSRADVRNRFRVPYAFDGFEGQTTAVVNLDADNNGLCRRSQSRWGVTPIVGIDAPDAPDRATANRIASGAARRQAMVRFIASYTVDISFLGLPLLSEIEVTDDELGLEDERFILTGVTPRTDGDLIDVQLLSVKGQ